jgi:lipopolysaccharide transport system permease protein
VLISASNSLANAGPTIVKINFSKKSLVIASLGKSLLSFFIQLILLAILFFFYKITPGPEIILIPVFMIPVLALALGLGFIFSLLNAILRDIGNILSILVTFLMFLTPVFYTFRRDIIINYTIQHTLLSHFHTQGHHCTANPNRA